jgi:hypothetical protein
VVRRGVPGPSLDRYYSPVRYLDDVCPGQRYIRKVTSMVLYEIPPGHGTFKVGVR